MERNIELQKIIAMGSVSDQWILVDKYTVTLHDQL